MNDLDVVTAWASHPEPVTLNREAIAFAWMFLRDAEILPGMYDDNLDAALQQVVWQLDAAELVASDAQRFGHLAPAWTAEELALLARTLRNAVEDFAGLLTTPNAI
ncbi:MAG TPA: hypothetical protein VGJ18_18820 [Gemmatimonadaceae bacterium]